MTVHYTKRAERDLIEIGLYTVIHWSEEQWEKYSTLLRRTCEEIVPANIRYARPVVMRPGLLRWRCERHIIFFRQITGGIETVRILHERMLPSNHL